MCVYICVSVCLCVVGQGGWVGGKDPCPHLLSARIRCRLLCPLAIYMGFGDTNSGPHAWVASALPAVHLPSPQIGFKMIKYIFVKLTWTLVLNRNVLDVLSMEI